MKHKLIGQKEEVLKDISDEYRIVSRDGNGYIITCDFRSERLNIHINGGIITGITNG